MISAERRILITDNRTKTVIFVGTSEASKSCADASEFRHNSEIPSQQWTAKTGGAAMKKRSRSAVERIVETPPSKEVGRTSHPEAKKAGANGFVCSCLLFYAG